MARCHVLVALLLACVPKSAPAGPGAVDPVVGAFATEILTLAESHSWNAIVERSDPSQRATQIVEMGMSTEQYVAELFGLHMEGNSIDQAPDGIDAADLARLKRFVVTEIVDAPDYGRGARTDVLGTVEVDGSAPLKFKLEVLVGADGKARLTGAVG